MIELLQIELLPYTDIGKDMCPDDYIICVDSQKSGGNILDFIGNEIACIDHHPAYVHESYLYSDIRIVGSCATLIAEYYQKLNIPMPENVATALLYGMKMDTAHFTRGVTALDIEMFAFLFPRADCKKLADLEKNTIEFSDLKSYDSAIENIRVYGPVGIASI